MTAWRWISRCLAVCWRTNRPITLKLPAVAHAFGVSETIVEDDFFTAVDDLRAASEDAGAGHLGETGFGSALFYTYICIDKDLLVNNLNGNEELANKTLRAFTEAALKVSPTGKQNSFASRAYASGRWRKKVPINHAHWRRHFISPLMAAISWMSRCSGLLRCGKI